MTNEELYRVADEETKITKEVTDILLELDTTSSSTTQAELNELLIAIYRRIGKEDIVVDAIDDVHPVTKEQFAGWVKESFDSYSADLFGGSVH
ncbi:MAG: hypothetical protein IJ733_15080 [Lachnospiraceae bacterium]|nr:hypothetical protein [Lachnospiraceae bacterium]